MGWPKTPEAKARKKAYDAVWRENNRDKVRKSALRWYYRKRAKLLEERAKLPRKIKQSERRLAIINHYSGNDPKCACCGERELKFLAIDHKNNDGAAHRRAVGPSSAVYKWIVENGFPDGFQILCHNCNMAKGIYGECPHGHVC